MDWKHPSIIALKGFPFSGKTSLSMDLACHLRFCILLSLDDILDSITPAAYSPSSAGPTPRPPPAEAEELKRQAFEILCGLAEKQMTLGLSVIIDYLPPSRAHLDRVVSLAKSCNAAKVVIVELQIQEHCWWSMRFEMKYPENVMGAGIPWYKPSNWEEVTMLAANSSSNAQVSGISRLLLNTDEPVRGRHVIQAIQSLVFCLDDHLMCYEEWWEENRLLYEDQ